MTEWPTTFPENLGAGARKLHQERNRRLTGAALYAKVTVECRKVMAEDYGIPESEYDAEMQEPWSLGSDMQPVLGVIFTRRSNQREVRFDNVYPTDQGELGQYIIDLH